MKYIYQILNVLCFIDNSKKAVGKTYIQKGIFFLQEGLGENLNIEYKIHFYGPYSEELTELLYDIEEMNYLKIDHDEKNERYRIYVLEEGKNFINSEKNNFEIASDKFSLIKNFIGHSSVEDMELLSTTLYFAKIASNKQEGINLTAMAKSHFSEDRIEDAFEQLEQLNMV